MIGSVSSAFGNTTILFALRKCQSLHSPSKALLCSLALTDLFVRLVVLPLFIAHYWLIILEMTRYYCGISITYGRTFTFIAGVSLENFTTTATDRYFPFLLRLRYRELVTWHSNEFFCIPVLTVIECILTAVWSGIWLWNAPINMIFGSIGLFNCSLITPLCYFNIYRGLRRVVAHKFNKG